MLRRSRGIQLRFTWPTSVSDDSLGRGAVPRGSAQPARSLGDRRPRKQYLTGRSADETRRPMRTTTDRRSHATVKPASPTNTRGRGSSRLPGVHRRDDPSPGCAGGRGGTLVLVEHERGFMRAFDEHLSAVRTGGAPLENVDYTVTWTVITGWEPWPPVIRLELKIDGLNARPRLLFRGETMLPLWLLTDGACFGLVLHPRGQGWVSASSCMWFLGPTPARSRPRPHPRRPRRAAADHAGGSRTSAWPARPNGSVSPAAPNRARACRASGPALSRRTTKASLKEKIMRDIATATLSGNLTRDVELSAALGHRRRPAQGGHHHPTTGR